MQHLSGTMTWSEGAAALLTFGIITFSCSCDVGDEVRVAFTGGLTGPA
jgi:hypothetical protein